MGQRYTNIPEKLRVFIEKQKLFFVATAAAEGRVNLSPKGMDSLRVLDENRVIWLNVTGSGNETAAHVQENGRMTLMFCSFEGDPMILRLYGQAKVIHPYDRQWDNLSAQLPSIAGARQVFDMSVDLVQTSCGMGVPFFDYANEREQLKVWATKKGDKGIKDYWREKNQWTLDEKPTHILPESKP